MAQTITVQVRMDKRILREFGAFDSFILSKNLKKPLGFAAIMTVFAVICFLMKNREQNVLLGSVLLILGLLLPLSYVATFFFQLGEQAKKQKLPRRVYTVALSDEYITVHNDMQKQDDIRLEWQKLPAAFRRKKAIYLYAARGRAFILPEGQADASMDELWDMIQRNMPEGRAHVK